jgi:hypothetical protein
MSTTWQPICASLDDSLALVSDSFGRLKAAQTVDVKELVEQLTVASDAARNLNSFVASVLPTAVWRNREDLDSILAQIDRIMGARSRLLNLATELQRGVIVHRRALRVAQMNQFREQAIDELQAQANTVGAPPTLPGPEAERWIEWACALKEPEDAEALQVLRHGFVHLDDFIANLEPHMWVVGATTPV